MADDEPLADGASRPASWRSQSRSWLTPRFILAADGGGLPLSILATVGNVNDCTVFPDVLEGIRGPRAGRGRPQCRPVR
ncbi:hypothetical protein AB0L25_20750 [Spirillospora sp. NPDC052242]